MVFQRFLCSLWNSSIQCENYNMWTALCRTTCNYLYSSNKECLENIHWSQVVLGLNATLKLIRPSSSSSSTRACKCRYFMDFFDISVLVIFWCLNAFVTHKCMREGKLLLIVWFDIECVCVIVCEESCIDVLLDAAASCVDSVVELF